MKAPNSQDPASPSYPMCSAAGLVVFTVFAPDSTTFGVTAAAVSKFLRMEKRFPM
jgi:hypothetical protein